MVKGFAVVAEEVGKLAVMSGKSAGEISELLEESTREVAEVVEGTRIRVQTGREVTQACADTFVSIGETMLRIAENTGSISSATKEQELGIKQTTKAMLEMDKVTQTEFSECE